MDRQKKEQFKWKFYKLAIMLNAIILLLALAVIGFFIAPGPIKVPLILVLLLIAGFLSYSFRTAYGRTKRWLDEDISDNDPGTNTVKESTG
jgi:Ca2+/Na+ antiporter